MNRRQPPRAGLRLHLGGCSLRRLRSHAQDRQRQRVAEDAAALQHLMRRAVGGGGEGGAAGLAGVHRWVYRVIRSEI